MEGMISTIAIIGFSIYFALAYSNDWPPFGINANIDPPDPEPPQMRQPEGKDIEDFIKRLENDLNIGAKERSEYAFEDFRVWSARN
jgi:hypothetical protein